MRLPADAALRLLAVGLTTAALSGCGLIGGGDRPESLALAPAVAATGTGPSADYPMVLGEPFSVGGQLFTPADTMNYDTVGYAALDEGAGVTLAHRTLPLPSYVEVTSLASGKTILARVERRGPMAGAHFVALSPAAAEQLGEGEGAAVRVRRVNPPEADRLELRSGRAAAARIETPKALVEVLRRKLPASGFANLREPVAPRPALAAVSPTLPKVVPAPKPSPTTMPTPIQSGSQQAVSAFPLPPLAGSAPRVAPVIVSRTEPAPVAFKLAVPSVRTPVAAAPKPAAKPAQGDVGFVIQAAAFASQANAQRAAKALGGYISPAGKLFRVRTGPFANRGQAEAALAKVRAAGYNDARVTTAG